ncbi:MAG: hypothetical protein ACP5RX_01045, partial [Minisyncoccia bacterium]
MKKFLFSVLVFVFFLGIIQTAKADLTQDCFNYIKAQDYQRALQSGLEAVRIYPNSVGANF